MNANEKFVGNKAVQDEKEIQTEHDNEEDEETIYQDNNNFLDSRSGPPNKMIRKERARRLLAAWFQNYESELESSWSDENSSDKGLTLRERWDKEKRRNSRRYREKQKAQSKETQTEHDNEEDEETIYQDNNNFLDSRSGPPNKMIRKERARRLLAAWFQNYESELESDE